MSTPFCQFRETDSLKKVVIGRSENYASAPEYVEFVNETQKAGLPEEDKLKTEFNEFHKVLLSKGVEVLVPDYVGKFVYDQLTPRDIGIVIGHSFVICNMVNPSRRYEIAGIFRYLSEITDDEMDILIPPDPHVLLEGGDIIVDGKYIYVGISQRTNRAGYQFLKETFEPEFTVLQLHCRSLEENENVLHLDCTFNIIGEGHALIYTEGFVDIPEELKRYKWIEVNRQEQELLATNVLSIDRNTVVSRKHRGCERVNRAMRETGLEVIEIPFDGAPATGGSFRCCTLPLYREAKYES